MSNTLLYPYLKEYLRWAKDIGIPESKKNINERKVYVSGVVNKYLKHHPEYISLAKGQYPPNYVIYGGKSSIDKLNKIYNAIKSINPREIQLTHDEVVEIDQLLTEITTKLESVKVNNDLSISGEVLPSNALIDAGLVQSTIDIIKTGLMNLNSIDATKDLGKIPTLLLSKPNYTAFNIQTILEDFNRELDRISSEKGSDDVKFNQELQKLHEEINRTSANILSKNTELSKAIVDINATIQRINETLGYVVDGSEIKIVKEFNDFLDEIKSIIIQIRPTNPDSDGTLQVIEEIMEMNKSGRSLSERVDKFNNEMAQYISFIRKNTPYKQFAKYYDGINNIRINNMFFVKDGVVNIPMIRDIITHDNLLANVPPEGTKFNQTFLEFPQALSGHEEVQPERPSLKSIVQKFEPPKPTFKGGQFGGVNIEAIRKALSENSELLSALYEYNKNIVLYNNAIKEHQTTLVHQLMHSIFLVMIATNQMLVPGYVVHEYIQRGALSLYNRILKNMVKDIETEPMKPQNIYLLKYHKFTIYKLHNFVREITDHLNLLKSGKLKGCKYQNCTKGDANYKECESIRRICLKDDIIDINECTGKTAERFLLLNHFKGVLMQYNVLSGNKITIYARINDLGQPMPPGMPESCKELMYLSMFDKDAQGNQCGKTVQDKPLEAINIQTMEVNPLTCQSLKDINIDPDTIGDEYKNITFTEVFDSTQFPTSSDISKYMTIETLLSQGNGLGMMTYGYSGTGKSFTLFGNAATQVSGILQTTLNDVNGLKSVDFRLIELYGLGMPYPDYWRSGPESIKHSIFNYKTQVGANGLEFYEVNEVPATDFSAYMECSGKYKETYYTIQENLISDVFKKFESFVDSVDKRREKEGRIRDTPNNAVSSRSVVIYDFQLHVFDKKEPIPFIIVDLPGREEIIQTYVDPYLDNPTIVNLLNKNPDEIKKLKLILGVAALNPLGLSIFATDIIREEVIDFVENKYNDYPYYEEDRLQRINTLLEERYDEFDIVESKFHHDKGGAKRYLEEKHVGKNITPLPKKTSNPTERNRFKLSGKFTLLDEPVNLNGYKLSNWVAIEKDTVLKFNIKSGANGFGYTHSRQKEIVLSTHLMNRIIMMNRFDLLKGIIKKVCDKNINDDMRHTIDRLDDVKLKNILRELAGKNFKSLYWYKEEKDIESLIMNRNNPEKGSDGLSGKERLYRVFEYNYYLTPYEGIYINENIIGLIKYLSCKKQLGNDDSQESKDMVDKLVSETICEQDKSLIFSYQQKVVRVWAMTAPGVQGSESDDSIRAFFNFPDTDQITGNGKCRSVMSSRIPNRLIRNIDDDSVEYNYGINGKIFDDVYKGLKESYKSDFIFNFKEPLITKILNTYMRKLFGYNVLYLLANYKDTDKRESRCNHQFKLLQNTIDFISSIVGTKNK